MIWGYVSYKDYISVPSKRLDMASYYQEMVPDEKHIYIEMPLDHDNPDLGKYKGFYILSPNFSPKQNIIFYLTDGQQNKVHPSVSFELFEEKLVGLSYVVLGRRGHYPTLFPEVYDKNGNLEFQKAMNLYGTQQQIEDIEMVRKDLERKGYLPSDGKIMLFGTSGAGILIQEYLAKYPNHVSRVILEATGAQDIALKYNITFGSTFTPVIKAENPQILTKLERVLADHQEKRAAICFMLFKIHQQDLNWKHTCVTLINEMANNSFETYYAKLCNPNYNFYLSSFLMSFPMMDATKVRMFELHGEDLLKYVNNSGSINIAYEWEKVMLQEYIEQTVSGVISVPTINLHNQRSKYIGEVLLLNGIEDNVFAPEMAKILGMTYPNARTALFQDTHAMNYNNKEYQKIRASFFTTGLYFKELDGLIKKTGRFQ